MFIQNPMILDPESEGAKVLEYVGSLLSRLDGLQSKAFTYKTYQKNFKVRINKVQVHLCILLLPVVLIIVCVECV